MFDSGVSDKEMEEILNSGFYADQYHSSITIKKIPLVVTNKTDNAIQLDTKADKIKRIKYLLKKLDLVEGCCNIDTIQDVDWVSGTHICMVDKELGFKHRRFTPTLKSSHVTNKLLELIIDELEKKVLEKVP